MGRNDRRQFVVSRTDGGWTTRRHNGNVLTCRGTTARRTLRKSLTCFGFIIRHEFRGGRNGPTPQTASVRHTECNS